MLAEHEDQGSRRTVGESGPAVRKVAEVERRRGLSPAERPPYLSRTLGLVLWWLAVVLALGAQRFLTTQPSELLGAIPMGVAALIGLAGTLLIERVWVVSSPRESRPERRAQRAWTLDRVNPRVLLLGVTALLAAAATRFGVAAHWPLPSVTILWMLGPSLATVGVSLWGGAPFCLRRTRRDTLELLMVVALLALAFGLRYVSLRDLPADVNVDEAHVGLEARRILSGDVTTLYGIGWSGQPEFSFAPSAIALQLFGNDLFGLRMASVIQGTLSVGLLYGIAKRLFSVRVAALAAFVLAVSQMPLHFSRTGNNYVGALFLSLALFYFLLRGLTDGRPVDFLFAGFAAALCASVYLAARLTPVIAVLYCLHRAKVDRNFLRDQWRNLVLVLVGAILFVAPQGVDFVVQIVQPLRAPEQTSATFVLSDKGMTLMSGAYHASTVFGVLSNQLLRSADAFNVRGETSDIYGRDRGPLLDDWSAALFVLGLASVTFRVRESRYFLLASWFWLTLLLGSVLTANAMYAPHIVGALGVVALLPVLALDVGIRGLPLRFGAWGRRASAVSLAAFVVLVAQANYVDYFQYPLKTMPAPGVTTILAKYSLSVNDRYRVYLLAQDDTSLNSETPRFLVPSVDGVDVRNHFLLLPLDRIPARKGVVFIVIGDNDRRLAAIRSQYPRGLEEVQRNAGGQIALNPSMAIARD